MLVDDGCDDGGGVLTGSREEFLVICRGLTIGSVRDTPDDEARHEELTAGLDNRSSLHLHCGRAETFSKLIAVGRIGQKHIARDDYALDNAGDAVTVLSGQLLC